MKCCNSMEGKMPIPSKISRATNWFSRSVSSCRKYPWHEFCKGLLFSPIVKILSNVNPEKACGLDELACRMLEDGGENLAQPILQIVNMSLGQSFLQVVKEQT